MTYRELFKSLTEDQLDDTILVYDEHSDEYLEVDDVRINKNSDVLDEGAVFLTLNN